jgi:anti-anti-sigma factor
MGDEQMVFSAKLDSDGDTAKITLNGELDSAVAGEFKDVIEKAAEANPQKLVLFLSELSFMASAGLRVIIFAKQKMGANVNIYVIGATGPVLNTLQMSGFDQAVFIQDSYSD